MKTITDQDVISVLKKCKENLLPIAQQTLLNVYKKIGMVV